MSRRNLIKLLVLFVLGIILIFILPIIIVIIKSFNPNSPWYKPDDIRSEFTIAKLDKTGNLRSERGSAQHFMLSLGNGIDLDMVKIPEGTFKMGSPDDEKGRSHNEAQINASVNTFYMSRYPVTQAQWEQVAKLPQIERYLDDKPSTFGENPLENTNLPVETISWEEAKEFCDRLTQKCEGTYRLPTEAEWEYACRANTTTPFYFGETITPEVANYDCNYTYQSGQLDKPKEYRGKTILVNSIRAANDFGLEGMYGNVWEWCDDIYFFDYKDARNNNNALNQKEPQIRVIRGGAWNSFPKSCRSAKRNFKPQNIKMNTIGFRVVCVFRSS